MDCNIIKDLLPLYVDGCCSDESTKLIDAHFENCKDCRRVCEQMRASCLKQTEELPKVKLRRVSDWKASVMQSVLFFLSFLLITVGVALEARTPSGLLNGYWAMSLVIPTTGFLLSLANWYFVRLYKSRKSFSNSSCLITLGITVCAYIWAVFHYEMRLSDLMHYYIQLLRLYGNGVLLTAVFCILSKTLSNRYALLLGRE